MGPSIGRYAAIGGLAGAARFGLPKSHVDAKGREHAFTKKQRITRAALGGVSGAAAGAYLGHTMKKLPNDLRRLVGKGRELPPITKGAKPVGFKNPKARSLFPQKMKVEDKIPKKPAIEVVKHPGPGDLQQVIESRKGLMKNASISLGAFFDELADIGW